MSEEKSQGEQAIIGRSEKQRRTLNTGSEVEWWNFILAKEKRALLSSEYNSYGILNHEVKGTLAHILNPL